MDQRLRFRKDLTMQNNYLKYSFYNRILLCSKYVIKKKKSKLMFSNILEGFFPKLP